MGSPTADAAAAPEGNTLRTGQNGAGRTSATASHTGAAAVEPTAEAVATHPAASAAGAVGAVHAAATATVDPTVKCASADAAGTSATTAAVAAAAERPLSPQLVPLCVDPDGAAGTDGPPIGATEIRVPTVARVSTIRNVEGAKLLDAPGVRDAEAMAPPAEAEPSASPASGEIMLSTSAPEAEESKENNTAGAAAALRQPPTRRKRNAGRQRASVGAGKGEADEGHTEAPASSSSSNVVSVAGITGACTTRAASSSASAGKREQEKVRKRYEPLLRETEEALQKVIAQGLPEAETLTHPHVYLELKRTILSEELPLPGEESTTTACDDDAETCREPDDESTNVSLSRVKRLLRALCEGSSLPLSKLIEAVRVVLLDDTDGAPQENVSVATLQSLIPVLLARRSLGIPPRRGMPAAFAGPSPADAKSNACAAESECGTAVVPAPPSTATTAAEAATASAGKGASTGLSAGGNASPGLGSSTPEGGTGSTAGDSVTPISAEMAAADAPATCEQGLPSVFSGSIGGSGFDRNEDTTCSCLWVWESAFLEGLPAAFKEKAKRDRERRAVISRRVRSLLRLQQAIEQGNEKEILTAQEKVAALEKKQQQDEDRRREQQLKKRRAEEARLEKEREKRQKEDARREKEKEKKKIEEQQKQAQQQSAGGGGGARSQTPAAAKPEKAGLAQKAEKKKELPSSMINQQLLMASWLTRKPISLLSEKAPRTSPSGGDTGAESKSCSRSAPARGGSAHETSSDSPGTDGGVKTNSSEQRGDMEDGVKSVGSADAAAKRRQAVCSNGATLLKLVEGEGLPWGKTRRKESSAEEEVIEVGGDAGNQQESLEKKAKEAARARAAAEAALWRVPEGKRHQFVERVLSLPKALEPLPASSDAQIPFFDGPEDPCASACCDPDEYLKAFVDSCAVPHSRAWRDFYSFFAINRQYIYRLPPGGGVAPLQQSGSGGGEGATHYCQEVREVRKGLALTDYADASLPDLQYLRTVVINLDEWKRPVRRLLLGKHAGRSTAWEQCKEESCIDYDRDSDEEWFETFDVDDLDDGREEEEEEDQEADEDKDWLVEDDDDVGGIKAGGVILSHGVRFESLCDWQWTFEGEEKPNYNDVPDACAIPTVRDPGWLSIYGCVVDDWGGEPFAMLNATVTPTRRKLTDEELCGFFRFCHGKIASKVKLLAHFHKENRHLRKSDLERKFREHMAYERRPNDKQKCPHFGGVTSTIGYPRLGHSCRAAEALNLKEELDALLEATRHEEALREAAQSRSHDCQESATDVGATAIQQSHPDSSSGQKGQVKGDSDGSPTGVLDDGHSPASGGSPERAQDKGADDESVPEVNMEIEASGCSPTLLASSPAEERSSFSSPSTTSQGSLHDDGAEGPCGPPQSTSSTNSNAYSVPAAHSAIPYTNGASAANNTSLTSNPSSAGSLSSVNNIAATLRPIITSVAEDAKVGKIPNPLVGANALRFEETDQLNEQRAARDVDCNSSGTEERVDWGDTVDPFASAAATAVRAALSAHAAAAAAYKQRPTDFSSATCVALVALTAAKMAKEVALQESGIFQNSKKFDFIVPSLDLLRSSVCSNSGPPKSPTAQDNASHLQSAGLEERVLSVKPQESRCDAVRTLVSSTSDRMASEAHGQMDIDTPTNASPAEERTVYCQQYSPTDKNQHDSMPGADDAGNYSRNVKKRRRSDGILRSCSGSGDGPVAMNKGTKRPSCPGGTPAASAGSQLKNALITRFFRVVPHAPKRISDDASGDVS